MSTNRGYITTTQYTDISNQSVTNVTEWERQMSRVEELVDSIVGPHPQLRSNFKLDNLTATASTLAGDDFSEDKDDYYNNMFGEVKQGTAKGDSFRVISYNGTTKVATVSGTFSATPDTTSVILIEQDAVFPRLADTDADSRPVIPYAVTLACGYAMEFIDTKAGDGGINADIMNDVGGKLNESSEDYTVDYHWSREVREIIGRKAYEVLSRSGLIQRTGVIV